MASWSSLEAGIRLPDSATDLETKGWVLRGLEMRSMHNLFFIHREQKQRIPHASESPSIR